MSFGHMSNNKSEQSSSVANLSALYTSPSMPNISLGRPPSNSVINIFVTVILLPIKFSKCNLNIDLNQSWLTASEF